MKELPEKNRIRGNAADSSELRVGLLEASALRSALHELRESPSERLTREEVPDRVCVLLSRARASQDRHPESRSPPPRVMQPHRIAHVDVGFSMPGHSALESDHIVDHLRIRSKRAVHLGQPSQLANSRQPCPHHINVPMIHASSRTQLKGPYALRTCACGHPLSVSPQVLANKRQRNGIRRMSGISYHVDARAASIEHARTRRRTYPMLA